MPEIFHGGDATDLENEEDLDAVCHGPLGDRFHWADIEGSAERALIGGTSGTSSCSVSVYVTWMNAFERTQAHILARYPGRRRSLICAGTRNRILLGALVDKR